MPGTLIIAGGGLDKAEREIHMKFIEAAGGPKAKLAIVATAGGGDCFEDSQWTFDLWTKLGVDAENIVRLPVNSTRNKRPEGYVQVCDGEDIRTMLRGVTGVWFTGGDQYYIAKEFMHPDGSDTLALADLRLMYENGGVIGGSSAGAAMMSRVMIAGGDSDTALNRPVIWGYDDGAEVGAEVGAGDGADAARAGIAAARAVGEVINAETEAVNGAGAVGTGTGAEAEAAAEAAALSIAAAEDDEEESLRIVSGPGFFTVGVVDQHFNTRPRFFRLIETLFAASGRGGPAIGFAVSEDTAMVYDRGSGIISVLGEAAVYIVDCSAATRSGTVGHLAYKGISLGMINRGDTYDTREKSFRFYMTGECSGVYRSTRYIVPGMVPSCPAFGGFVHDYVVNNRNSSFPCDPCDPCENGRSFVRSFVAGLLGGEFYGYELRYNKTETSRAFNTSPGVYSFCGVTMDAFPRGIL